MRLPVKKKRFLSGKNGVFGFPSHIEAQVPPAFPSRKTLTEKPALQIQANSFLIFGKGLDFRKIICYTIRVVKTNAPVAQLDRVPDSDSEGHGFKSCSARQKKHLLRKCFFVFFPAPKSKRTDRKRSSAGARKVFFIPQNTIFRGNIPTVPF